MRSKILDIRYWMLDRRTAKIKNLISVFFAVANIYYLTSNICLFADPGVAPEFGSVPKKISIQRGTAISAWLDRGDVAKSSAMTPVGDGTWEIFVNLTPNATYNFIFFAVNTGTVQGLTTGSTYYDTPPTDYLGTLTFPTSTSSTTISGTSTGWFGKAGAGDDRRLVRIPPGPSNTTYYVFANFAHTPNPPQNFNANPSGGSHVTLTWNYPKDSWNSTDLADVIAGGRYFIYRSSNNAGGPFSLIVSTIGSATQYKDLGLEQGVTYYYAIVSSDAYRGVTRTGKVDQTGIDDNFVMTTPDTAQQSARPTNAVPTIFRVDNRISPSSQSSPLKGRGEKLTPSPLAGEGGDEGEKFKVDAIDFAKLGNNALVYLTPWTEDGRTYPYKVKARITSVYLPPASSFPFSKGVDAQADGVFEAGIQSPNVIPAKPVPEGLNRGAGIQTLSP